MVCYGPERRGRLQTPVAAVVDEDVGAHVNDTFFWGDMSVCAGSDPMSPVAGTF